MRRRRLRLGHPPRDRLLELASARPPRPRPSRSPGFSRGTGASARRARGPAAGAGAAPACAPSTSALMIRPPGPDPVSEPRSTPFSSAIRRASGLALTRPSPSPRWRGLAAGASGWVGEAELRGLGWSGGWGLRRGIRSMDARTPGAAGGAWTAEAVPTGVPRPPPLAPRRRRHRHRRPRTEPPLPRQPARSPRRSAACRPLGATISIRVPAASDSKTMFALSVSISTSSSPSATSSPTDFIHLSTVPSSIESESRGMTMSSAIRSRPRWSPARR